MCIRDSLITGCASLSPADNTERLLLQLSLWLKTLLSRQESCSSGRLALSAGDGEARPVLVFSTKVRVLHLTTATSHLQRVHTAPLSGGAL
eukprot:1077321-Pyramimonas_sp.AAC.1